MRFDEISAVFRIDLPKHNMKAMTCDTSTAVKYAPEKQSEMHYTEISSRLNTSINPKCSY